jgi:hypothetical protein
MITVSIIIINFNTFELTCNCIQSVLTKEWRLAYEIIVVDNGSSEVNPFEFKRRFPKIILIKNSANVGFAKGNNIGIARSQGKYILLLNSDTILENDAVTRLVLFLERNPLVGVVASRLEYPDGRVQHNCQRFPSLYYKIFELLRLQRIFKEKGGKILLGPFFSYEEVVYPDWVWGTCFMFERKLLAKLPENKLADDFFMYVEDMQWCMEFRKLNLEIAFVPDSRVIHLMGASRGGKNYLIEKNTNLFMMMYYPRWKRILILLLDKALIWRYAS